jgi:hypothetical protein
VDTQQCAMQSPVAPAARLAGRAFDTLLSVMQLQQPREAGGSASSGGSGGALLEGIARDLLNLGTAECQALCSRI